MQISMFRANAPAGVWRLETVQMFDGYNEDSYLWNTAVIPEIGQADLSCCNVSVGGAAVSPEHTGIRRTCSPAL